MITRKFSNVFLSGIIMYTLSAGAVYAAGSSAFRTEVPDAGAGGMGSAFVAQADTPAGVYYNPAGMTQIDGTAFSVGTAFIVPRASHTSTSGNETKMKRENFLVPHTYLVTDLGTERFALGFGALSEWGSGTNWDNDSFSKYIATKSESQVNDFLFTGAYQVTDQFSLGAGFRWEIAYFNKEKRVDVDLTNALLGTPTAGATDGQQQLKGDDKFIGGYVISGLYKFNDRHRLGVIYRSEVDISYEGTISLEGLSGVSAVVFGGGYSTKVKIDSNFPRSAVVGYAYTPNDKWTFEFDVEWMDWSVIEDENVQFPDESSATRLAILDADNPASRDWEDAWSFAFGTEYKATESLALRAGYYYHQQTIPEIHFETNIVDSDRHGITAGLGIDLVKDLTLDLAYHALIHEDRDIDNAKGSASGASIDGEYEAFSSIYMATLTYHF